ncbi:MAG: PAS domain S-box protein [Pseudomonadota bacterium]
MRLPSILSTLMRVLLLQVFVQTSAIYADDSLKTSSSALEKITLQLRWKHQFQFAGYYAALHKGFYQKNGLDVSILPGSPAHNPVNEVLAGRAQYAVANSELLFHFLKGDPLLALAAIFQHSPSILLSLASSGIHTPQDIVGKRIMMLGGSEDINFLAMLSNEGVNLSELNITKSSHNIEDLIKNKTDVFNAYLTNEPYDLQQLGIKTHSIKPINYGVDFYSDILFTSQQELDEHPQRVKAFREASLQGWEYAMSHQQEIIKLILTKYNSEKTRAHLQYEAQAMEKLILNSIIPIGNINPGRFNSMAQQMVHFNLINADYSLDGFIYDPDPEPGQTFLLQPIVITSVLLFLSALVAGLLWRFNFLLSKEIKQRRKTEKLLEKSERYYRCIIENLQDVYYMADIDGVVIQISPSVKSIFGYDAHEIMGTKIAKYYAAPFSRENLLKDLKTAGGQLQSYEVKAINKQGEEVWISANVRFVIVNNNVIGVEGTIRDISKQKKAQQALQNSKQRILEAEHIAHMGNWELDISTGISNWSDEIYEIVGYDKSQLVGIDFLSTIVHKKDWPKVEKSIQSAIQNGEKHDIEYRIIRPDGSERWLYCKAECIVDKENKPIKLTGIAQDITERKQAEKASQLAASVFTHAREGIMITTAKGLIIDVNDSFLRITGYKREKILGKNPNILKSDHQNKKFYDNALHELKSKGYWSGETWNKRFNGELYPQMMTISAVCDEQGVVKNYVSLFNDITLQKQQQKQLEQIAHYDSLTRLPNRVLLDDRLHQAIAQVDRRGLQLAIAYLDLDGFKEINDTYGHAMGDKFLIAISQQLEQTLRQGDTLARLGGDEFIAIWIDLPDNSHSDPLIQRLLNAAAAVVTIDNIELQVSASIGITFYPQKQDINSAQLLLHQADRAMYKAKSLGRNQYQLFEAQDFE